MKRGLIIVLVLHLALFFWKNSADPGWWQQDNYWGYSRSIISSFSSGKVDFKETWLYPGLAWLLVAIPPWLVAGISLAGIYVLSWLMTKNWFFSALITVFPPIVFEQTSKLSTESLIMMIWLASYYLFQKKKLLVTGLFLGLGLVIRPIAVTLWLVMASKLKKGNYAVLIFPILLVLFNLFYLHSTPWHQITAYRQSNTVIFPIWQLFLDVLRAIDWGYYRILISGLTYFFFSLGLLVFVLKLSRPMIKYWALLTFLYVAAVGPVPMLEYFRRYISVWFPLIFVANYRFFIKNRAFLWLAGIVSLTAFW